VAGHPLANLTDNITTLSIQEKNVFFSFCAKFSVKQVIAAWLQNTTFPLISLKSYSGKGKDVEKMQFFF